MAVCTSVRCCLRCSQRCGRARVVQVWDKPMVEARDLNATVTREQYAVLERQNLLARVELRSACGPAALLNYIDGITQFVDVIRTTCSDFSDPLLRASHMDTTTTRVAPPLGVGGVDMVAAVLRDPHKLVREEQRQILFLHDYASLVLEVLRLWVLLTGAGGADVQQVHAVVTHTYTQRETDRERPRGTETERQIVQSVFVYVCVCVQRYCCPFPKHTHVQCLCDQRSRCALWTCGIRTCPSSHS